MGVSAAPYERNRIGDYRGQTIGSLRPKTIGQLRTQIVPDVITQGLMLVPSDSGLLVGKKQQNLANAVPQVTDYGSAPVYKEHTFQFCPSGGMGESIQSSHTDHRYHYAIDCWVIGGLFGKGPLVHPVTPANSGLIRRFVEALSGGVLKLFFLAGAQVFIRNDDSNAGQAVSRTRAGHVAMDAARFAGGYASPVDGLYVSWEDGLLEEYNGTAWVACALPSGFSAHLLCVVGDELWAADMIRSQIRKVTADPKVAANWSGLIQVGNPSTQITAIRQTQSQLFIFKSDGDVFTVDSTGGDIDLYPGLQNTIDPDNGRTAWPWQGSLWFRTGRAFWQLDVASGGSVLTPTGPGRALGNQSEVRGPVQAFVGWNSQMAFGAIYNAANATSYLLTYGNWMPEQGDSGTNYKFTNQWDGAIAHWTGRKVTALWVSSIPSDARLYIGFADGGYDWIKLVPYPLTPDGGAEFTLGPSYMVPPIHHDQFQADNKQFIGFSIFCPSFPTGGSVTIDYRLRASAGMPRSTPPDLTENYAMGDFLPAGDPFTFNGQRQDLSPSIAGKAIEVRIHLASGSNLTTPVLEGVGFHQRLVPAFRRDFQFVVDARDYAARRDGASIRQSGRKIRDLVMDAAAAPATISLEFPDETVLDLAIFDYTERMVAHSAFGGQAWAVDCQATQFAVLTQYGMISRTRGTRIGDLRGWDIVQLKRF